MTEILTITAPSELRATPQLPASKSISNRALVISALACRSDADCHGMLYDTARLPENLSDCDDTKTLLQALAMLDGQGGKADVVIDIGAAGTAMRFLTALLATSEGSFLLTGTERMKRRPIGILVEALQQLGADIRYEGEEGFPPLRISGRQLDGGIVEMQGSVSSQYISALLMLAPVLHNGLELRLKGDIVSRPYIDLTLWMMREFGADAGWTSGNVITVRPSGYQHRPYLIENDWSAASYWYEMMALTADEDAEIRLPGLHDSSKQGDAAVRYIFSMLGVKTEVSRCVESEVRSEEGGTIVLRKSDRVAPRLDYDFVNSPDLVQTIVVTCAAKGIPFHFRGLQSLRIKETDRIDALVRELRKVGFMLRVENADELVWDGERCEPSLEPIDTYDDHRMALSFAPLSLRFPQISIRHPQVVTKSYPHFWSELQRAKFTIQNS
ncbi:MAG: 3-phosphoshikimate 1-carboxyvinyltransferase [Prevotella sp.]|nr:3-phosphoshikimate 1-carboxyvinyltransferase [Prevotella sp.]